LKKARAELADNYAVKLGSSFKDLKENTEAEFYVVLVPGQLRKAQVGDVKFIRGDEKLRPLAAALKGAKYNLVFPDETATKVIRRGTLLCQAKGGECSFFMLSPELVPPVN
jgi:hypothetical protein